MVEGVAGERDELLGEDGLGGPVLDLRHGHLERVRKGGRQLLEIDKIRINRKRKENKGRKSRRKGEKSGKRRRKGGGLEENENREKVK